MVGFVGFVVGVDAVELVVDVVDGGLRGDGVFWECVRGVVFGVLESDDYCVVGCF